MELDTALVQAIHWRNRFETSCQPSKTVAQGDGRAPSSGRTKKRRADERLIDVSGTARASDQLRRDAQVLAQDDGCVEDCRGCTATDVPDNVVRTRDREFYRIDKVGYVQEVPHLPAIAVDLNGKMTNNPLAEDRQHPAFRITSLPRPVNV